MAAPIRNVFAKSLRASLFSCTNKTPCLSYTLLARIKQISCHKFSTIDGDEGSRSPEAEVIDNSTITRESKIDPHVVEELERRVVSGSSEYVKYKGHSGVMRRVSTQLPARLLKAIRIILEKYPVEPAKVDRLSTYLQCRIPPATDLEVRLKAEEVERQLMEKDPHMFDNLTGADLEHVEQKLRQKVKAKLRKSFYHWKPMQYDAYTSVVYLLARLSSDYSVLTQCFTEMAKRDPDFRPTSIYHHGSKVGASIWASNKIWSTIGEHYCVEESSNMSTLARLLLQDGNEQERAMSISGIHFRQFQPSAKENKFSMVVAPYMLMEQPSQEARLELLLNLWEMTETYLVLIELGGTAGFSLINEAREFLLNLHQPNTEDGESKEDTSQFQGHVFAPCPHDKTCPRAAKALSCITDCYHRKINYETSKQIHDDKFKFVKYSHVILKKGPREKDTEWPRILRQVKAKRHTHCHLCLPSGQLQHVVVTKGKFDKHVYGCARYASHGDFLPVSLSNVLCPHTAEVADILEPRVTANGSTDDTIADDILEPSSSDERKNV